MLDRDAFETPSLQAQTKYAVFIPRFHLKFSLLCRQLHLLLVICKAHIFSIQIYKSLCVNEVLTAGPDLLYSVIFQFTLA